MKLFYPTVAALSVGLTLLAVEPYRIQAPPMTQRDVVKPATPPPGKSIELQDGNTKFILYIPDGWQAPASGEITLIIQFHGGSWFAIDEHLRHGLKTPLIAATLGEGSSKYRVPFEDRERLQRWMDLALKSLQEQGAPKNSRITVLDISSFSAGYGAVREILKSPKYYKMIQRIVLSDSMYAGLSNTNKGAIREPFPANIAPWIPFARAAARGEKTFILTHSQVPTDYATSGECAAAVIKAAHAPILKIPAGSTPAASDPNFPLQYQSDIGDFHVWGYGGTNKEAHMTQVRHLADVWLTLDAAKNP